MYGTAYVPTCYTVLRTVRYCVLYGTGTLLRIQQCMGSSYSIGANDYSIGSQYTHTNIFILYIYIYICMNTCYECIFLCEDIRRALAQACQIMDFLFLLQHLLRLSSIFCICSIALQHLLRLFSTFYNFCYSCCALFRKMLLIVQKVRARGGLSGSPWAPA